MIRDGILDGLAGASAGSCAEVIFYGVDSYKVMKQSGNKFSPNRLFSGLVPVVLLGSAPSFGIFFVVYTPLKSYLSNSFGNDSMYPVIGASLAGGIPSSLVAVPADMIKKQLLVGQSTSTIAVIRSIIRSNNNSISGLFTGWRVNLAKDIPFAAIKMTLFEETAILYKKYMRKYNYFNHDEANAIQNIGHHGKSSGSSDLNGQESAFIGLISGALTGIITCPLDVINTRIKSGEFSDSLSIFQATKSIIKLNGVTALFRGVVPRITIIGLGSTAFWYMFALFRHQLELL